MLMVNMHKSLLILLTSIISSAIYSSDHAHLESNKVQCANNSEVFLLSPKNGFKTTLSEIKVIFGSRNVDIAPAGKIVESSDCSITSGHHHLIIDSALPNLKRPIPSSKSYIHFGGGQTEAIISLDPGKYSLQLLLGDYAHVPHEKPVFSEIIEIEVLSSQ